MSRTFPFAFERRYLVAGVPFGVTPWTTGVTLDGQAFEARFGPWRLRTTVDNIASTETSGGFAFVKTAGPAHLSFTDRGVTFATNASSALCVTFVEPVGAIDFVGRIKHPGLTVSVADPQALADAIEAARA